MMNRLRTFCARHASVQWAVFGVIMLVVGLAATFPDDALQARLLAEVEQVSGLDVSVTQWAWRWPFRLEWRNVRFEPAGAGVIELPLVRVRPQIWRALTGRAGVDVAADLPAATPDGGGQVAASLSRGFWWSRNLTVLSGSVERVNLAGLGIGSPARGILHATFEQRWPSFPQPDNPDGGEGEWQFEVRDLVLPSVSFGTATLPPLTFSSVTLRLACRGACLSNSGGDRSRAGWTVRGERSAVPAAFGGGQSAVAHPGPHAFEQDRATGTSTRGSCPGRRATDDGHPLRPDHPIAARCLNGRSGRLAGAG